MLNVMKAPLKTELAKKIWREYNSGTSAGVNMTPKRLIEPKTADSFASKLISGLSFLNEFADLTR